MSPARMLSSGARSSWAARPARAARGVRPRSRASAPSSRSGRSSHVRRPSATSATPSRPWLRIASISSESRTRGPTAKETLRNTERRAANECNGGWRSPASDGRVARDERPGDQLGQPIPGTWARTGRERLFDAADEHEPQALDQRLHETWSASTRWRGLARWCHGRRALAPSVCASDSGPARDRRGSRHP
jgi:hypothetical protein